MSSEVELRKVATELLEVAKSFLNIAQHCKIASGVCGCGEEMDGHSHPMSAGHSPTDMANQVVNKTIADAEAAIEAYNQLRRSASPSIGRVGVKALEWQGDKAETPFGPYTVIRTPDGYQSRFQRDEVAHVGFNAVDMFYGARRAAQDHAQADYESRIRSTLVYHEEPAGDTQGAAKLVAWRAITVAGNVLYFAANDKPVEPSWEIIPLYAAPAALVSPPDNGEPTEAEIDDAVRCIGLGVSAGIADTVNVGAALRRFVAGRAALQSHNEGRDGVGNDNDGREDSQP